VHPGSVMHSVAGQRIPWNPVAASVYRVYGALIAHIRGDLSG
jgi:hypothetical protein